MRTWLAVMCLALTACGDRTSDEVTAADQRITNGVIDTENRYASTGAMLALRDGVVTVRCSGTLIAPTLFLTAAHCFIEGPIWVSFDNNVYAPTAELIPGTFEANPDYQGPIAGDIAVIRLAYPADVDPVELPTLGLLDTLAAEGTLDDFRYFMAGYGSIGRTDPPHPSFIAPDGLRWFASAAFISLNDKVLNLNQQEHKDNGGSCFGDSGGPVFLGPGDLQVAIIIAGDSACENTTVALRLDTPEVRAFLSQYVDLP